MTASWSVMIPTAETEMARSLELYVLPRRRTCILFSPAEVLTAIEADAPDRIAQFTHWVAGRQSRLLSWIGRGLRSLHQYYLRLEDKIDPIERVLKAMASTDQFVVYANDQPAFRQILKRQR